MAWLADPARTGRGTGTPGGPAAAAWIADRLAEAGLHPAFDAGYLQTFEAPARATPGPGATGAREAHSKQAVTANVVAVVPGRDPEVAGRCVVVGAHHDHLGFGGAGSLAPGLAGTVHPGADDNASGVAALLAVGRALAAAGPARRTVVLAAFGAEELGLLGSAHLAANMPPGCAAERLQLMVNLDTVGRPKAGKVYVDGAATARGLRALVEAHARRPPRLPLDVVFASVAAAPSDHTSFAARGAPVLFLFTGAEADYHRPSDTPDQLDYGGLAAVARLAWRVTWEAAEGEPLVPVHGAAAASAAPPRAERDRGYGAYLGAIPDFAEREAPGVLLTGVRPGSPAEQAGLGAGDVLLRVGATRLRGLQDLALALRAHRPGEEVEVEWERGGRRSVGKVRLGERK